MTTVHRFLRFLPVLFSIALPIAAEPPDVSLPYGDEVEIEPGRAAAPLPGQGRLPIKLVEGLTAGQMAKPVIHDVRLGGRRSPNLAQKITVDLNPGDGKMGPALVVGVAEELAPGTYNLAVEMRRTQGGTPVELLFKAVKPAATLESLPKEGVSIERVVWFWRLCRWSRVVGQPLRLRETNHVPLTRPKVEQILAAGPGGSPISGKLTFPEPPSRIEPGPPVDVSYAVEGWFPLGKSTGTVAVTAPELTAPLQVPFTISVRIGRCWLLFALLLGLLVGYLVRVELQRRLEIAELQEHGSKVVDRLYAEKGAAAAAAFRGEVEKLRAGLMHALRTPSMTAEDLRAKIQEIEAALKTQLEALAKSEADLRQRHATLDSLVATSWQVPDEVKCFLEDAKADLAGLKRSLDQRRLDDAEEGLSRIKRTLANNVKKAAEAWLKRMLDALSGLDAAPSPLLTAVNGARAELELAKTALGELGTRLNDAQIDAVTLVPVLHAAFSTEADASESLARSLSVLLATLREKLSTAGLPVPQAVAAFAAEGADLLQKAGELSGRPSELVALIAERHLRVSQRLGEAVLALIKDQAEREEVRKLITDGRLVEAVDRGVEAAKQSAKTTAPPGGDKAETAAAFAVTLPEIRALRLSASAPAAPTRTVQQVVSLVAGATPPPSPPPIARARTTIARAKLAQTLIAGALVAMTGYFLFDDTFIGTAEQLATAFVWAFGLDFGLDKAIETSRKLVKV